VHWILLKVEFPVFQALEMRYEAVGIAAYLMTLRAIIATADGMGDIRFLRHGMNALILESQHSSADIFHHFQIHDRSELEEHDVDDCHGDPLASMDGERAWGEGAGAPFIVMRCDAIALLMRQRHSVTHDY